MSHEVSGCTGTQHGTRAATTISLSVLPSTQPVHPKLRKSEVSKWRAVVLIGVHVLMAAHIIQWAITKRTVSPVEPSESMYTLEKGEINAGFVFFALALLSTFIFGRFFCGWGCHVVALQDLCSHWMNKIGIRPKPWRSRLLLLAPLVLALYMFVWPTFKREALVPLWDWANWPWPLIFGQRGIRPGFHAAFMVEDFWATFAPWYIAIPFLLACGFGAVYFLGSKGFCTYGCPYGGFFAPLDKISFGRIVVNNNCEGCGHCTAVCTSNVRVHQEVRDFGKVMDPGCMKCMDCVSVCPNEALSFKFAAPAITTKRRSPPAATAAKPEYDMSLLEEAWVAAVGLVLFFGFRGMLNSIPLLMAMGLAGIGAYCSWKLVRLLRVQNVRLHSIQLRLRGRFTAAGLVFAAATLLYVAAGAWGIVRDVNMLVGDINDAKITISEGEVLRPGYVPTEQNKAIAQRALAGYTRASGFRDGGWGWKLTAETPPRLAWLAAVAGDLPQAERWILRSMEYPNASEELATSLTQIMALQNKFQTEVHDAVRGVLKRHKHMHGLRMSFAFDLLNFGKTQEAAELAAEVVQAEPSAPPGPMIGAAQLFLAVNRPDDAIAAIRRAIEVYPQAIEPRLALAQILYGRADAAGAINELRVAVSLAPQNPALHRSLAQLLRLQNQPVEADAMDRAADALERAAAGTGSTPPSEKK